jgi:hypothetical protein
VSGCFGNDPYDRYLEAQADEYWGANDLTEEEAEAERDAKDRDEARREEAWEAEQEEKLWQEEREKHAALSA